MISTIRTSRKSALLLAVGVVVTMITLFAFKDLNEKLTVMTASNAAYQKMTDSQSERIRTLQSEISDLKGGYYELLRTTVLSCSKPIPLSMTSELTFLWFDHKTFIPPV